MYKIVHAYIRYLNKITNKNPKIFPNRFSCEDSSTARKTTLELLDSIYKKYSWSEEFIISFTVYCNFFVLNGFHKDPNVDIGLNEFYSDNTMNAEDKQYLDYIYCGIIEQNIEYFKKALDMNIYDFDIPKYYIYLLCFLELCLKAEKDFDSPEGRKNINILYNMMEKSKENINGEIKELLTPLNLDLNEEVKKDSYNCLLPEIIISNQIRKFQIAANSDLDYLSKLSGIKIGNFEDIIKGKNKLVETNKSSKNNMRNMQEYYNFANELIKRIVSAKEYGDINLYNKENIEMRDSYPVFRKDFLKLPVSIDEKQYRNIFIAKQISLNFENEILIQKNERMVEDYSHSVENIMKPSLISEVANCLREDDCYRDIYKKIMYSYYNEVTTQNECRLLKMVHNVSVSKGTIRKSISKAKLYNDNNMISIRKLVYKAINQIGLQLAEDSQKTRYMFIMNKMNEAGIDIKQLDNKLWESSKEYDIIYKFLREKINFELYVSKNIENINLNEEELGTSFLYTRIVELISNAFTYGNYLEDKKFNMAIYLEKKENSDEYLILEMSNTIGDRSFSNNRTGNGLNATTAMLERINIKNSEQESFVITEENKNGVYKTKFYIDADLYFD